MALVFNKASHSGLGTGTEPAAGNPGLNVKLLAPAAVLMGAAAVFVDEGGVLADELVVAANAEPDKVTAAMKYKPLVNSINKSIKGQKKTNAAPCGWSL